MGTSKFSQAPFKGSKICGVREKAERSKKIWPGVRTAVLLEEVPVADIMKSKKLKDWLRSFPSPRPPLVPYFSFDLPVHLPASECQFLILPAGAGPSAEPTSARGRWFRECLQDGIPRTGRREGEAGRRRSCLLAPEPRIPPHTEVGWERSSPNKILSVTRRCGVPGVQSSYLRPSRTFSAFSLGGEGRDA